MNQKLPEHLYHYTTIDTLALILRNRTIRLSSLSQVDDKTEGQTYDFADLSKYFFASCWTADHDENIFLWDNCANNMRAVRIRLPPNPFEKIPICKDINPNFEFQEEIKYSILPFNMLLNKGLLVDIFSTPLIKIIYTKDKELLFPSVKSQRREGNYDVHSISFSKIGKYKRKEWHIQNEWRYLVLACLHHQHDKSVTNATRAMQQSIVDKVDLPISYIDLKIEESIFKSMQITIGPKATDGEKIIISDLVNLYNQGAEIVESDLANTLN